MSEGGNTSPAESQLINLCPRLKRPLPCVAEDIDSICDGYYLREHFKV
jgi:hypothetical protein